MSLTVALRAAQSGILTNQAAIAATAKNIANVHTEGYSRKLVNFENQVLAGAGAGVSLGAFTRAVDESLLKDLRRELSDTNFLSSQLSYYERIQDLFGAPEDNNSISHILSGFTQAAESLSLSPDQSLDQNEFIRFANEVALKINKMTERIQDLRAQADQEIADAVFQINGLTTEIQETNFKIIRASAVNADTTELMDKRDLAITKLSELIDVQTFPRSTGDLVVFTSDGFTLVDGIANILTHTSAGIVGTTSTYAAGNLTGIYAGEIKPGNDFTDRIKGGEIGGLIEQRDTVLPNLQAQLDELASELIDAVNQLHNQGTNYPGLQTMTGTRTFIDPANQTITLDPTNGTADVTITLFDVTGNQQKTTTLNTIMVSGLYGTGTQTSHGAWTIDEVAQSMQDWFQANGASSASVAVNTDGKFVINTNITSLYVAFRDETATAEGSTQSDIEIDFNSDAIGGTDETVKGFSQFFGLNNLYTDSRDGSLYESAQLSSTFTTSAATLTLFDNTNGVGTGKEFGSFTVAAGTTLADFVTKFNNASLGATAALIPDGSGFKLRILHTTGKEMVLTQASGDTLLDDLGITRSQARSGATISVRKDLLLTPSLATTGRVQYDTGKNEYRITAGDNNGIQSIAELLNSKNIFDQAGGLSIGSKTFTEYATSILASNASRAAENESHHRTQSALSESLNLEHKNISGVSLDEEMTNLILYQQAFSAAARVLATIQKLFQILEDAV